MKTLLIFPPQAYPANPYLSVPLLAGQLKNAGYDVKTMDLNVDFFNRVLSSDFLSKTYEEIKKLPQELEEKLEEINKNAVPDKNYDYLSEKIELVKSYLENATEQANFSIKYVEQAVNIYKSEDFYNPSLLAKAFRILSYSTDLLSLRYFPTKINLGDYSNKYFSMNYDDLMFQIESPDVNVYSRYFETALPAKKLKDYDLIVISIPFPNQIVPALTLLKHLKANTKAKICIGGNTISRITEAFEKHPEFFDDFADYILSGDGEYSIIKLAELLQQKIDISKVPGLLYKDNLGKILYNPSEPVTNLEEIADICLDDYDFKDYFIPKIVLPMQLAKGCYWGKCAFCDFFYGKPSYFPKSIEKVIGEIKTAINKYGITHFEFTDEAIPPTYYLELADAIIKEKLNIKFFSMARLEEEFTKENLEKLHKAGLTLVNWGFEAASKRVLEKMNKGINPDLRLKILKDSAEAEIWNRVSFIFGFPGETLEEGMLTVNTIKENLEIINSYNAMVFQLRRHSNIKENSQNYDIIDYDDTEEFSDNLIIKDKELNEKEKQNYRKLVEQLYQDGKSTRLWRILMPNAFLILYLEKYGRDFVRDYRLR